MTNQDALILITIVMTIGVDTSSSQDKTRSGQCILSWGTFFFTLVVAIWLMEFWGLLLNSSSSNVLLALSMFLWVY